MIEKEMRDIISELRKLYEKRKELNVCYIEGEEKGEIAAVDGGSSILWSNGIKNIGVLRYGFVIYDDYKIKDYFVENKVVLTENIDPLRIEYEMEMVKKASEKCDFILYDGALVTPHKEIKEKIQDLESSVVGISKKTQVSFLEAGIPDTMVIKNPGKWYYKVDIDLKKYEWLLIGDVYIAKLHEQGRNFRIDVVNGGEEVFPKLAYFSKNPLCFGYPYPLLEAHRLVCMDDKKEAFKNVLRKIMFENGMEKEYFDGIISGDKITGDFHTYIDKIV
ncbi:MAG: DNA double-strand break repair nuclease NurA [Methanomicrobia archaeon]|nr:DNA double-strand break repair nuclease NurA [Methanomicrobia archaeon]HDM22407.1 hypothetical protein [Methanomicrobia archaeon]